MVFAAIVGNFKIRNFRAWASLGRLGQTPLRRASGGFFAWNGACGVHVLYKTLKL